MELVPLALLDDCLRLHEVCGPELSEICTRLFAPVVAVTLYPCYSQPAHYKTTVRAPGDVMTAVT